MMSETALYNEFLVLQGTDQLKKQLLVGSI